MTSASEPLAELVAAVKRRGSRLALDGLDLAIAPGERVALLGPNGAGKTTAIALLLGRLRPDGGEARLFGGDPADARSRMAVGATPQETDFPATLRVGEIVDFVRAHFPDPEGRDVLLARFGLEALARRPAGKLSGGERRRLALALAFAGRPRLVFLDEPTTALDVGGRRQLWAEIQRFTAEGGTLCLTTHYLDEVEALATRVVVLDRGRPIADGTPDEIRRAIGLARVGFAGGPDPGALPGVVRVERRGARTLVWTREPDALVRALVAAPEPFHGLEVSPASLEEAFLVLTGGEAA
jgi:ABC-2 type transport system ATP-binding protein